MYNPYQYPNFQMPNFTMSQQPPAPQMEIVKVNGENGAQAFQMAPNSSAILLDTTNPIVWVVMTDGAGYKTVTPFDITPHKSDPVAKVSDLDTKFDELNSRLTRLEERMNSNGQSNNGNANKKQPYNNGN